MSAGYNVVINLASGGTLESTVQGQASTGHLLLPRMWLRTINEAAQKRFYATQIADSANVTPGNKDIVFPKRRKFLGSGGFQGSTTPGTSLTATKLDNLSGVQVTPVDQNYSIYLTYQAVRTNAVNVIKAAREELTYAAGDAVDTEVYRQLADDTYHATSNTLGSQAVYGGDATSAATLTTGDVITTDHIAEAKRKLQSTTCKYWTYGTSEGTSSESKNPWHNEASSPFVFLMAPEQEEVFLTDSQFINASQYGSNEVVMNGEIGRYLGVKMVVANNTPGYTSGAHPDGTTVAVAQHRCVMTKAQKGVGIAYALKPRLRVVDFPSELETRLILEQSYKAEQIHPDAIVHVNVTDS